MFGSVWVSLLKVNMRYYRIAYAYRREFYPDDISRTLNAGFQEVMDIYVEEMN